MNSKIKLLALVALLPFIFLNQSCEQIKDAASFDHDFDLPAQAFTVDSNNFKSTSAILEWTEIYHYDVSLDLKSVLADYGYSSASFRDGSFTEFRVDIVFPPGVTYNFVDRMRIGISLDSGFDPITYVGETQTIAPGSTSVVIDVTQGVDIMPYIEAPTFYVKLEGFKVQPLPTVSVDLNLNGHGVVTIDPL